jgi:hypothetical protein
MNWIKYFSQHPILFLRVVILCLLLQSCSDSKKESHVFEDIKTDSLAEYSFKRDSIEHIIELAKQADYSNFQCFPPDTKDFIYNLEGGYGTFNEVNYLYSAPDSASTIIDTLAFLTPVNLLKTLPGYYAVCTPKAKTGFLAWGSIFQHVFLGKYDDGQIVYLAGTVNTRPDYRPQGECSEGDFQVVKINRAGKILDQFIEKDICWSLEAKQVYSTALKNVHLIFTLSYHYYSEQGNNRVKVFIDNGSIRKLIEGWGGGDGGFAFETNIYLPVYLNGKKIVLAKNGELTVDPMTGDAEIFPYPKNLRVPIEELIIVQKRDLDSSSEELNEDGSYKTLITNIETEYYQWDGISLKRIN